MRAFFAAWRFLTLFPLPPSLAGDGKDLRKSVPFFPVAGFLLGALAALIDLGWSAVLPPPVASCLTVFCLAAMTGGLHLDGLADTADGFFSARDRQKMLDIMRDSRIGTMGVLAVLFVMAVKMSALASLPLSLRPGVLLLMPTAGRTAILLMMTALPYARPEGGLATVFEIPRSTGLPVVFIGLVTALGWALCREMGVAAVLVSMAAAWGVTRYTCRQIGGFTGDTLGAVSELTEAVLILAAVAWLHVQ